MMNIFSKLKPANRCLRPSKTFQFDILEKELKKITGEIGIDAAAQNMKNRRMFKTKKYFGIDISLEFLRAGIKHHNIPQTFGLWGDLTKLEKLPEGGADVVVSTNTLYILKGKDKSAAIWHLCRLTAPRGVFICDAAAGRELEETLAAVNKNFGRIRIVYMDSIFSRVYEKIFENKKTGDLGSHRVAGAKPFLILSWLISRLEYLTRYIKPLNSYALVICDEKFSKEKNPFDISRLPLIDKNIYRLSA